ncbi:MAG: NAD(P)-dependent oxidoreductase [Rhodospirillaceae bacterium]|nr:NAD(P)-dependent oxidoreductase [Rhodospirillaceae bacterium]
MQDGAVAITGALGMIGQETSRLLAPTRALRLLDIAPPSVAPGKSADHRQADVMAIDTLREAFKGCSAVVHLAALQIHPRQDEIYALNTVGTWNVLQAAREAGIRKVVLLSSESAVGLMNLSDAPPICPLYLPIDEQHPLLPVDGYGVSKLVVEELARAFVRRGDMQIVALRPTSVYVPGMEDLMRTRREEGHDPWFWLYVEGRDVAEAIRLALDYDGPAYDCFFIGARDMYAPEPTLTLVEQKFGRLPEIRNPLLYRSNPHASIYDISRAERILGLTPKSDWRRFIGG